MRQMSMRIHMPAPSGGLSKIEMEWFKEVDQ